MDKDIIIRNILGERYEEGKEIAEIVIDYIEKHPNWKGSSKALYKDTILKALNSAIYEVYGHKLEYYLAKSRKREMVDVRHMAMYLYHEQTGFSLNEVGGIFGKHHSSVLFAYNNVENLRRNNKMYAKDFKTLKETFKKYL